MIRRYGALDAEDLLQETWLRLTPYREAREIRHPQALLMRIATNLAADMSARQFHRTRHASETSQSHGWGCELPGQADEVLAKQLVLGLPVPLRELGVRDRFDPVENLRGGADYLARQIRRFGDLRLALAAYNAGPARVARLGRVPDIAETQAYVATVVDCYLALTAGQGITSSTQCRPRGAGR